MEDKNYKAYINQLPFIRQSQHVQKIQRHLHLQKLQDDHRREQLQHYQHLRQLQCQRFEAQLQQQLYCEWLEDQRQQTLQYYRLLQPDHCRWLEARHAIHATHADRSASELTRNVYRTAKGELGPGSLCSLEMKLVGGSQQDIENIFLGSINHIVELMTHPTGNQFVQWLLAACDENQRLQILERITRESGDLVRISCHRNGNYAVQEVIRTLQTGVQFFLLTSALKPGILTLVKNKYGYLVALCCLEYLLPEYNQFLIEAVTANFVEVAKDPYGNYVLQECLIHCDGELICEAASAHGVEIAHDRYGNHVLGQWLSLCNGQQMNRFLDRLDGGIADLCMHELGNLVANKCIKCAGDEQITRFIKELIRNPRLDQIMQDRYGNYVIQAALTQSQLVEQGERTQHMRLLTAIKELKPLLWKSPYGKKVLETSKHFELKSERMQGFRSRAGN